MDNSRITILGMAQWNYKVFDDFVVPEGVDKDDLISFICSECSDFELLYPNYDILKDLIGMWSRTELANWTKIYESLVATYNPIHNYDRYEEFTDNQLNSNQSNNSGSDVVTGYQKAFNDTSLVDATKQTTQLGTSNSTLFNGSQSHNAHLYGNIGVTTSQQMIEAEVKLRIESNIYHIINESFKNRFCLLIY